MNAARFARHLIDDGVEPKIAQPPAEHLAAEFDRTVATKEPVETAATREAQLLRVEMRQHSSGSTLGSRIGRTGFKARSRSAPTARCAGS